eukprot:CAMPEP_0203638126 /NCGR_PEP_ID=MMETSP0088-20131115/4248_1 /ASSEMBLY_ACC=CAM_ASM_001087 /TAXON_ID=426623 /ORGANISM="Chaetoceros affinis, Strain CCMP159" /LENGTH=83 /DNA_ID=CAMNT_0050492699 /DNA_START=116 /DNA_END=367 /DNA_ORIENTATION=-
MNCTNLLVEAMNLSQSSENKENVNIKNIRLETIVTDDEGSESMERTQGKEELEPLDYRQDWSKETIDTFEKLKACFQLEQVIR